MQDWPCHTKEYSVARLKELSMQRLLIHHAKQVVKVCENGELVLCGEQTKTVSLLDSKDGETGYSLVVNEKGAIEAIGSDIEIKKRFSDGCFTKEIDASGKCVLPGLIDGHTHPVWLGDRVHEFAMKRLHAMLRCGTTTIEAKSGYGLDAKNEIKMLRVLTRAQKEFPMIEISSTYCGAHAIPRGKTMEEATDDIVNNQIPTIKKLMDQGQLLVDNIDVFCEKGVFDTEASRQILEAGKKIGLHINFHGDELHPMKSGELGALLNARAISHLEEVSDAGVVAMADKCVTAVLLPTTAYILKLKPPPARQLIEQGVPVALGSDFNPNAFCYSMPVVMHMACCILRMSMTESLIGATLNAAASIGLSKTHGSLEVGKQADILIIDAPKWEHLIYQFAGHDQLIDYVIKRGDVVYSKTPI
ncbi:probable imidazolonepropionase isoform X2 [Hydractinia symbiolongicarpus]|uniref:probable imidazolonepropionase isoform X2 n=1 Tax=Hydractinia symbiolongicarpus TaxID=13093 RepID=UPI00254E9A99|nr:probable imidazolonepropionase isoform X2 [Hydractinia symbiolongicarpus]